MYFILINVPDCKLKYHLTDYAEIMFSKLRPAGLNHHLQTLSFFTDAYCARVSNKHCLVTFFIDAVTSCSIFDKIYFL